MFTGQLSYFSPFVICMTYSVDLAIFPLNNFGQIYENVHCESLKARIPYFLFFFSHSIESRVVKWL